MKIDLSGKRAIVTGASRGIGRETALALADGGADVACVATNDALLREVALAVEGKGRKAIPLRVDVSDFAAVEAAVKKVVETWGTVDILVNNAAITRDKLLMAMTDEDWAKVLDVNLKGAFHFCKATHRAFIKQRKGSIVNVTSVAGIIGNPGQANYAASKGGLIALTKSLARELASRSIRVNAVAPGFVKTDMTSRMDPEALKRAIGAVPLQRAGEPGEIASVIAFLASDLASYITGQVIVVDGGMVM